MSESKDKQTEGVPSTTYNSKFCIKCGFTDINDAFRFCPHDGTKLQNPTSIRDILDTKIKTTMLIYQKQDDKFNIEMTVEELNRYNVTQKAISKYNDGTFDIAISGGLYKIIGKKEVDPFNMINHFARVDKKDVRDYGLNNLRIPYLIGDTSEKLVDILSGLIYNNITNPVCRREFVFNVDKDCWNESYPNDCIAKLRLI